MAIFSGKNTVVILGTTTVSAFVSQVTLNREVDAVEITTMSNSDHVFLGGLNNDSVTVEFFNDFAASSVNDLVEAALGSFLIKIMTENSSALKMINPRRKFSPFCVRRVIEKAQSGGILIFFTPEKDCGGSQSVKI